MRFLIVAERELRAAARRPSTYRVRWITAVLFFGLLIWLLWAYDGFSRSAVTTEVFRTYSILSFLYCIVLGTAVTADCLSAERREGTLGLLFLTNLNSAEIVAGKFCSAALTAVYGLAAICPMLALPLLMGGITFTHFWKTILALLVTTVFSLSLGFVATVFCRRQFVAIALALGLGLILGAGAMGAAAAGNALWKQFGWADELAAFSPLYLLASAEGGRVFGKNHYWLALLAVTSLATLAFAIVIWRLSRTWRDGANGTSTRRAKFRPRLFEGAGGIAFRRRMLNINPFFWLGARQFISSPVFMASSVILVAAGSLVAAPFFSRTLAGGAEPMLGQVLAWLWIGLAIHAMTAYFAAMAASQRLAEDKQTGALELILSTPASEQTIFRGLWLAYARRMFFPALLATLVHLFLIWQFLVAVMAEVPVVAARRLTTGQVFWKALLQTPISGDAHDWPIFFMLRCLLLALGLLMFAWLTLGWLGRWLGLRMKHAGFAPVVALALVFLPPALLFSAICYLIDVLEFDQWPERQFLPGMMWLAFGMGATHCFWMAVWARNNLKQEFRATVMNRFQPDSPLPWPQLLHCWIRRIALGLGASTAGILLIVLLFYRYENWRGHRQWMAFQGQLNRPGPPVPLAAMLPQSVAAESNFVRSASFSALLVPQNPLLKQWNDLRLQSSPTVAPRDPNVIAAWNRNQFAPLWDAAARLSQTSAPPRRGRVARSAGAPSAIAPNRTDAAHQILQRMRIFDEPMRALAGDARLPFFLVSPNGQPVEFINPRTPTLAALEQIHQVFAVRACAALELGNSEDAAEDLLTTLRLVGLARQSSDLEACQRAHSMLIDSVQPFWEGIVQHRWTPRQLAGFQEHFARFDFLSDFTNAVPRVIAAHIETWSALFRGEPSHFTRVVAAHGNMSPRDWQPRAWWLDQCIELHRAGQDVIARTDVAAGHVTLATDWSLDGLPLDFELAVFLQQPNWRGSSRTLVAFAQTCVNQAVVACALERHFLTHSKYPDSLASLPPQLAGKIPNDPLRGQPMAYERVSDRSYILRGVGLNTVYDRTNRASDDWLWAFPTNAPPSR